MYLKLSFTARDLSCRKIKMAGKSTSLLFILISLFFSSLLPLSSTSEENEDEREFDYLRDSDKGPRHWGHIHPEWEACSNGKLQSPIDLLHERVEVLPNLGRLKRNYRPAHAVLMNRGHDIMLKWKYEAGSVKINGTRFWLKQCHWHSPSEHTFNGSRYHLEVHMVHEAINGEVAVIGITYKYGRPDSFLQKLMPYIKPIESAEEDVGIINPNDIKFGSRKYYRYLGSLTVPPCTEGVIWTIIRKVRTVSREQVRALREAVHDGCEENARPLQDEDQRTVGFYRPNPTSGLA